MACLPTARDRRSFSATLPLAEGYSTSYRNFDVQTQKVKLMQLKVAGSEDVTVPAGTFAAHRVEVIVGGRRIGQDDRVDCERLPQAREDIGRHEPGGWSNADDRAAIGRSERSRQLGSSRRGFVDESASRASLPAWPARFRRRSQPCRRAWNARSPQNWSGRFSLSRGRSTVPSR